MDLHGAEKPRNSHFVIYVYLSSHTRLQQVVAWLWLIFVDSTNWMGALQYCRPALDQHKMQNIFLDSPYLLDCGYTFHSLAEATLSPTYVVCTPKLVGTYM